MMVVRVKWILFSTEKRMNNRMHMEDIDNYIYGISSLDIIRVINITILVKMINNLKQKKNSYYLCVPGSWLLSLTIFRVILIFSYWWKKVILDSKLFNEKWSRIYLGIKLLKDVRKRENRLKFRKFLRVEV